MDSKADRFHQDTVLDAAIWEANREAYRSAVNARWARNVCNGNPHKSGSFVFGIAGAYLMADDENQNILQDAIERLRYKYLTWDIEEKQNGL